MNEKEKMDFILNVDSDFKKLTKDEVRFINENSVYKKYDARQNIHSADINCLGVIFLVSGRLRVYIMSDEGKEVTLYRIEAGEVCILTASCILPEITFDVYVDADEDSETIILNTGAVAKLIDENINMENFTNKIKAQRLSDVMWTMQQILFYSFDKRLAIFLYEEYIKNGEAIHYSHMEIAKYLGSAREVVSRMLKYFENEGILKVSRKEIEIIDKKKLLERVQG